MLFAYICIKFTSCQNAFGIVLANLNMFGCTSADVDAGLVTVRLAAQKLAAKHLTFVHYSNLSC